jgi:predicted aldo/keto reductase-like oxidoreductase
MLALEGGQMKLKKRWKRRDFIRASALGLAAGGMSSSLSAREQNIPDSKSGLRIKEYRTLGRTGFKVSDLATGSIQDESLLGTMLEHGVNYIDTAESYPGHHRIVSSAIKDRDRKSLFITSKMEPRGEITTEDFLKRARKALRELDVEYLDCMMMHCPDKAETVGLVGFHEAMGRLKSEGLLRFVGISHHGSFWLQDPEQSMDQILLAAVEDGRFDVMLLAYNFLQMDRGEKVLEACKEKNIGTVLMKTNPISKYYLVKSRVEQMEKEGKEVNPLYREGLVRYKDKLDKAEGFIQKYGLKNPDEIGDAAVRFVLGNPHVNSVCCSLKNFDEMERTLKLSGTRLNEGESAKLAAYREGCADLYCRHACGICEPNCPRGVPVNTIMRYQHYFVAQGREREAMGNYAAVPGVNAKGCSQCQGFCESACPHGVPIQGMLCLAHEMLSMPKV